jgi:flagellin-like protein
MNFEKVQRRKRKAISPVLATVILIAITLIAAIAIAGFVFGLFGSFTSSAQVSASVTSCVKTTGVCTLTLTNSGTSNVQATACSIQDQGTAAASALTAPPVSIGAGTSAAAVCTITGGGGSHASVGSQAVGSLTLSNGASVPFSGVWS